MSFPPPTLWLAALTAASALLAAAATLLACRWRYRRRLAASALRLRTSEQARALLLEQAQHTRRQIQTLSGTLDAERAQVARLDASRRRGRELAMSLDLDNRPQEREAAFEQRSAPKLAPLDAPVDFADTQILD